MKKILLLGSNGQLAFDIKKCFDNPDYQVNGLTRDNFEAGKDAITKLSQFKDYDFIINCIAYHKVNDCEDNFSYSFNINAEFVFELTKFSDQNNITLFHLSTDYVFNGSTRDAYIETDQPSPINVYGTSKLAGEYLIQAYCQKYFIFRVSSLFGSISTENSNINFVDKMIHSANNNISLKVIDDQIMSPTHCHDVATVIKHFIDNDIDAYGIYHANNSGDCSWFEFAKTILELSNLKADLSPITFTEFHSKARRPQFCSMDNSKLNAIYKMPHWKDALKEYLELKGHLRK